MARGTVEWSFYSWERPFVFLAFCYALYAYGPSNVPPLWQNEHGVLANFTEPDVKIAGVAHPFFFGLATAPAHVEDQVRWPLPCSLVRSAADDVLLVLLSLRGTVTGKPEGLTVMCPRTLTGERRAAGRCLARLWESWQCVCIPQPSAS